jgi:hypothetical protein
MALYLHAIHHCLLNFSHEGLLIRSKCFVMFFLL